MLSPDSQGNSECEESVLPGHAVAEGEDPVRPQVGKRPEEAPDHEQAKAEEGYAEACLLDRVEDRQGGENEDDLTDIDRRVPEIGEALAKERVPGKKDDQGAVED